MAEPFLSEIRIISFNFPPKGWAFCNGQTLPINQNQPLFALLGTRYGGNGETTFMLPNLRGRVPMHMGQGHTLGEQTGAESHALTISELPTHLHQAMVSNARGTQTAPTTSSFLGTSTPHNLYGAATNLAVMAPGTFSAVGGSQAHPNMQPYLVLSFIICLQGIFPSED
jgi:microcystin-dependent protein